MRDTIVLESGQIFDIEEFRNRTSIFADRYEAGQVLSKLVGQLDLQHPLVMAIPAGGLPVAVPLAKSLNCQLDIAVVSKITLPWDSEAGYGAVAFDGSYLLNEAMISAIGLDKAVVAAGLEKTRAKVVGRVATLRKDRPMPALMEHEIILVDDGLASGFTMRVAVDAIRRAGARKIIVAVPTGHDNSVQSLAAKVDAVCCPNIRSGYSFAVASAYRRWSDVSEAEAEKLLFEFTVS